MSEPSLTKEIAFETEDRCESEVQAERHQLKDLLYLDTLGRIDPVKEGRHLLAGIRANLLGKKPCQSGVHSAQDLIKLGKRVQVDFEDLLLDISHSTGGYALLPGLKKKERIQQKISHEYGGNANGILDVVRGSVVFDSLESLYRAVEQVHGMVKIVAVEDRFEHPSTSGYRDLKFNLELTDEKGKPYITELQFHLQEMLDFKEWETSLYNERRILERERIELKETEADPQKIRMLEETIARLQYDSQSVYSQVWKKYTKDIDWN